MHVRKLNIRNQRNFKNSFLDFVIKNARTLTWCLYNLEHVGKQQ